MLDTVFERFDDAAADVFDGAVIMLGNFAGPCGTSYHLIKALEKLGTKNLTIIANTAGGIGLTLDFDDHRILFDNKQIRKVIASFPFSTSASRPSPAEIQIRAGKWNWKYNPR